MAIVNMNDRIRRAAGLLPPKETPEEKDYKIVDGIVVGLKPVGHTTAPIGKLPDGNAGSGAGTEFPTGKLDMNRRLRRAVDAKNGAESWTRGKKR